jgi:hypothetical protein
MNEAPDIFGIRHEMQNWGADPGQGAAPDVTIEYRALLERFVRLNMVRSIVDLGGRDWAMSRAFEREPYIKHRRFDVVGDLGAAGAPAAEQLPARLSDLPGGDLLLIKDVMQHLLDEQILELLDLARNRFRFALITNSFEKEGAHQNGDIQAGQFRTLDLTAPPYNARGVYVLEFWSRWERIRTLLILGDGPAARGNG